MALVIYKLKLKGGNIVDINSIRNYYTRNNVKNVYSKDVNVKSSEATAKAANTDIVAISNRSSFINLGIVYR